MIAAPRATESTSINGISHPQLSAFLTSLQLTDSFFPSGLYTLSHGLEAFAQAGLIKAENLELLLIDHLRHNVGPADGAALACAHRAVTTRHLEMAAEADLRLSAVKLPKEARTGSQRVGRQLLKTAVQVFRNERVGEYLERAKSSLLPCNHAVVLGLITASHDIERHQAITGELYAFVSGALSAAVRLAVIDHLFAQAVLHRLKPIIAEVALSQSESSVQDIASSSPLIDIMAMQHERAQLRLFVS
jgi:urease accessory protein